MRVELDRLPGDTTTLARPTTLIGKAVNRWQPNRTGILSVLNRVGTAQQPWNGATITYVPAPDSVMWAYNWGTDSLIVGENFVCCVPLEDQGATSNNLGLGTPFAGNLEVYPLYRMKPSGGLEEASRLEGLLTKLPTITRGVLFLPEATGREPQAASLLDISGRKVLDLHPGANDVSRLSPGVYFVRPASGVMRAAPSVAKVVVTK